MSRWFGLRGLRLLAYLVDNDNTGYYFGVHPHVNSVLALDTSRRVGRIFSWFSSVDEQLVKHVKQAVEECGLTPTFIKGNTLKWNDEDAQQFLRAVRPYMWNLYKRCRGEHIEEALAITVFDDGRRHTQSLKRVV